MNEGQRMLWAALFAAAWNDKNRTYTDSMQRARGAADAASQVMTSLRVMVNSDYDKLCSATRSDVDDMMNEDR